MLYRLTIKGQSLVIDGSLIKENNLLGEDGAINRAAVIELVDDKIKNNIDCIGDIKQYADVLKTNPSEQLVLEHIDDDIEEPM